MTIRELLPAILPLCVMSAPLMAAPAIGDKAPAVKVAKWMTQAPPTLPGGKDSDKNFFLVEFWATWCPPCLKSIPHLAELHRKYGKDGLVILGVSNEESETIDGFLKRKTKGQTIDMPYYVGADDEMGTTNGWMEGIQGIPHAFLVNKSGNVVWTGNPLDPGMNGVIEKVLSGKYDVDTAKKQAARDKRFGELSTQLKPAFQARDKDKLFKVLDEMISLKPTEVQPWMVKRQMYTEFEMPEKLPSLEADMEKAFANSSSALMELVNLELGRDLDERNPQLLYRTAARAAKLSNDKDPDAYELLGRVQCEFGMLDAAIATQKKAISLASDDDKKHLEKVLAYYNSIKKIPQN
jgi:thiol-disulfide isomerase/thioredoxin